ncbi:MAG: T9SS type A sorting domain-containing protein [Candidatus Marinimicrobia bacterium]|nr:T9SS type A sorting domain-containing protein [Candidatus Neomarinimicrobiota bacterium]
MNISINISRFMYPLLFFILYQELYAQTWEEIDMHFPLGDTIELKWSDVTTFTNKDTGWLSTAWVEEVESGKFDFNRKIYRTEDGGKNWEPKYLNRSDLVIEYAKAYSIYSMEPDYFIAIYNDSVAGALISEDGGETWINSRINDEHLLYRISRIHFFDDLNGIAFNNKRWFTSDGGYTWEKSNDSFENETPSDVCFVNDSLGWMVSGGNIYATDSGYLANTTDGGKTWQYQDSLMFMELSGVDFIDSLKGFAVTGLRNIIYSTEDGGEHWNWQGFTGLDEFGFNDIGFLDEEHGWILASGGRVMQTADGGQTWEVQLGDFNSSLGKLIILKKDKVAYIFGNKDNKTLVLYRADLSTLAVTSEEEKVPDKFYLTQNYPNPFNPLTTIRYQLTEPGNVKLEIFDIKGRLVDSIVNEYQPAGYYSIVWDADNSSSGLYFYRLQTDGFTAVKKCVKLK